MRKVYILSKGKFAKLVSEERQSGFWMSIVEYEDGDTDTVYSSDVIRADIEYTNAEIWNLFEKYDIRTEIVIREVHKKKTAGFDGNTKFIGATFEIGDRWMLDRIV